MLVKKKVEKVYDSNQEVLEAIQGAVNIEVLKLILESNGFTYNTHKKVVVCDICVGDPYYLVGGFENKAGIFQFYIDVHHTLNNMYPAQSRQFLNLKKSIVRHMCKSQTHINLK